MHSSREQQGEIRRPSEMNSAKIQRKTIEWKKTRDLFKKIRDNRGIFHAKMGIIKDTNSKELTERKEIKEK